MKSTVKLINEQCLIAIKEKTTAKDNAGKKYELTDETVFVDGHNLYRIRALKDFADVKAGDLGGFVESELALSHEGNCWVYEDAKVFEGAEGALVWGNAQVYGDAKISDSARIYENAKVGGYAEVYGKAKVYGNAQVEGFAAVFGNAQVYADAIVNAYAIVGDNAKIRGQAKVGGHLIIGGAATID